MWQIGAVVGITLLACARVGAQGGQGKDLSEFAWLTGTWEAADGPSVVEEIWTAPTANVMIGMSRTVEAGRTASFEFLRIEKRGADVVYVPQPGGRPPVAFRMTSDTGGRYVFEQSGDDKVKRIEYRRDGADSLHAKVEGVESGKPFQFEIHYRRRK